jgi:spore germination protein YaaH
MIYSGKRMGLLSFLLCMACLFTTCRSEVPAVEESAAEEETEIETGQDDEFPEHAVITADPAYLPSSAFGEIWGYVINGREQFLTRDIPLSDVGYFGAEVNCYGRLIEIPRRSRLADFPGRVHLVVTCPGYGLSHFVLAEGGARRRLISELVDAARPYDGLQIDFENIPKLDGENFASFLEELRRALGNKIFTIAISARVRKITTDPYDYERIAPLMDRVLVMAYDEHWSSSAPGPVASMNWCKSVAAYALKTIGPEKLIMGIPFYGRAWIDPSPAGAKIFTTTEKIILENRITEIRRENGIPVVNYSVPVQVTLYYEDDYSLSTRMEMYSDMGVRAAGFWRIGQESPTVWKHLSVLAD